jgi:hypothetical protein
MSISIEAQISVFSTEYGFYSKKEIADKALEIIRELEKELQQSSISNVYWELCYNKEKEAHEKLKSKLVQFSEENYKKNQKGYYGCDCYSEIDGILEEESK